MAGHAEGEVATGLRLIDKGHSNAQGDALGMLEVKQFPAKIELVSVMFYIIMEWLKN